MRYETHNLDGQRDKKCRVYDMPPKHFPDEVSPGRVIRDYWGAVTDVPCPIPKCAGHIRWYENGYVPGYRICDVCHRHFLARGDSEHPTLIRVGSTL